VLPTTADKVPQATADEAPPTTADAAVVADAAAVKGAVPPTAADKATSPVSGPAPGYRGKFPAKAGKRAGEEATPNASSAVDQNSASITASVLGLFPRMRATSGGSQPRVLMPPPALGTSAAAPPRVRENGSESGVESHRAALSSSTDTPSLRQDHSGQAALLAPSSADNASSEKRVAGSDIQFQMQEISTRSDAAANSTPDTPFTPVPKPDQEQSTFATDRAAPADQLAPALIGVLKTTDGTQSVTVRLQPAELGQVQIRVDRTTEGVSRVDIITDRPETLELLQRDQPKLDQALDQAGVPSSGRNVSFLLAPTEQMGAAASRPDSMSAGSGDTGQGQSGGAWRESSDSRHDPGSGPGPDQQQARARWFRAGLDITA
jgi:flagellar hook-length control protein FliK